MTITDRRKHPRVTTDNLVSYVCTDDSGNEIEDGEGRAINISVGGILIETPNPIRAQDILLTVNDIEDELIDIKSKIVYCSAEDPGMFRTGIQFLETNEKVISFVIYLLKNL